MSELLSEGWRYTSVENLKSSEPRALAAGPFGSSISSKFFVDEGVPVIRGGNLSEGKERFIASGFVFITPSKAEEFKGAQVKAGDLVFTCWGTLGQVGVIPKLGPYEKYVISNKQLKLRPARNIASSAFLYYYFSSPTLRRRFNDVAIGAAVPGINLGILRREIVPLPPLKEQEKIAAILTAYDDLIENNKRRIALLEKMAEETYREWFVRFRFPGYQTAEFEKGIPKGWVQKRFDEFCTLQRGYDLPDSKVVDGIYPVIASTSVKTYHNQFKVDPPVITTGRSGSLGTVLFSTTKAWPLNTCLYVRDFKGNSPYLIYYTLKGMDLQSFNAGAGVPSLNRNHLSALKLYVPDKTVQDKFSDKLDIIFQQIDILKTSTEKLTNTKNLLLPRLISGKLSVTDLDIQFPPSMLDEEAA